jgi:magnesium transporter
MPLMIVDCGVYREGRRRDGRVGLRDAEIASREHGAFVWVGLHEPTAEEFDSVRREFDLHELAVEDAIKAHQRPKLELYGDSLFMVLRTARYIDETETVEFGEILLFVGERFLISVRHGEPTDLHGVRLDIEARPDLLSCGPGAVLHAIVDRVVDDYEPVIAGIEDDIEEVEQEVFPSSNGSSATRS